MGNQVGTKAPPKKTSKSYQAVKVEKRKSSQDAAPSDEPVQQVKQSKNIQIESTEQKKIGAAPTPLARTVTLMPTKPEPLTALPIVAESTPVVSSDRKKNPATSSRPEVKVKKAEQGKSQTVMTTDDAQIVLQSDSSRSGLCSLLLKLLTNKNAFASQLRLKAASGSQKSMNKRLSTSRKASPHKRVNPHPSQLPRRQSLVIRSTNYRVTPVTTMKLLLARRNHLK